MEEIKKHAGGRPPLYTSVEELNKGIERYFAECDTNETPYTMSGLAYALGMDRRSLINYGKDEKFFHSIKKAKERVEKSLEEKLVAGAGNATGIIFNLKNNYDWRDKQEIEAEITATNINVTLEDDESEEDNSDE